MLLRGIHTYIACGAKRLGAGVRLYDGMAWRGRRARVIGCKVVSSREGIGGSGVVVDVCVWKGDVGQGGITKGGDG